jgi:hypothetical protein
MIIPAYSLLLHSPSLPWGLPSAVCPPAMEKDLPTSLNPTGVPAGRFGEKNFLNERKGGINKFFLEENPFYIFLLELQQATPRR